jgi:dihydroxy-acid dehydratase
LRPTDGRGRLVGRVRQDDTAALMGSASADVPAIVVSVGPMLNGRHDERELGACTDCGRATAELRAGTIDATE